MTKTPAPLDPIARLVAKYQSNGHPIAPTEPQPPQKKGWAGFAEKTLWDWLNLLGVFLIPIVITAASIWFSVQLNATSLQLSDKQHQSDQTTVSEQQRAATLKTYMDDINVLLLHEGLRESKADAQVRAIASAKTLVALSQLQHDGARKGELIRFLYSARLIGYADYASDKNSITHVDSIIKLRSADLRELILRETHLSGIDLRETDLRGADLSFYTTLSDANLSWSDLEMADLSDASIDNANLSSTNLSRTNLSRAAIAPERLARASRLESAMLPDGSRYPSHSFPIPHHLESKNWMNAAVVQENIK